MEYVGINKKTPVIASYDVVVAGAGPSGMCAAVAASRCGSSVALVERYGIVGGNLTIGNVGPVMGKVSNGTMGEEVTGLLKAEFNQQAPDIERAKIVLVDWLQDEGVEVYLQSPVVEAVTEGKSIKGVVVGTHDGLASILAKVVVDATGDGTVSYLAGAACMKGRDSDGLMQPASIMFTLGGVDEKIAIISRGETKDVNKAMVPAGSFVDVCKEANEKGLLPKNVDIVRLYYTTRPGERLVNATQANNIDGTSVGDLWKGEVDLRNQMELVVQFLKQNVPGYENCYVQTSSNTLGVRESRRITGTYILNDEDLQQGARFNDVIVHNVNFLVDIHNPGGAGQAEGKAAAVRSYDIPYRCIIPETVDNLITTGRCISGTHRAHASYRVMNICMALGQASGIAAALSAKKGVLPRNLKHELVQKELTDSGVVLFE
ncbi:MAG: FAD-dependent oxidoreductase [Spirochaetales bacterium]|nr:FAD-dependent oxidoreductase [Spirochaetales bacterium]